MTRLTDSKLREIREALEKLGYHKKVVTVKALDKNRAEVKVSGERFGIYDFTKHTFVD